MIVVTASGIHRATPAYRTHYLGFLVAMAVPWVANVGYVTNNLTLFDFDPTPFSFLLMGAVFYWLITRRRLFVLLPVARDALLDAVPDPVLVLDADGTVVESFNVATGVGSQGGTLGISGSTITLNPANDLATASGYYVTVDATAVADAAGNTYAGIADATTFNFTTAAGAPAADTTKPVVTASQTFTYDENSTTSAVLATVAATDDVGVTGFQFANGTTVSDRRIIASGSPK